MAWVISLLAALNCGAQVVIPDPDWTPDLRRAILATHGFHAVIERNYCVKYNKQYSVKEFSNEKNGVWLFTSGTTATPKAQFRSVEALIAMVDRVKERSSGLLSLTRPSALVLAPLHHGFGLVRGLLLMFSLGAGVIAATSVSADHAILLSQKFNVSIIYGWPSHFRSLNEFGDRTTLANLSLKWCVSSSLPLDPQVAQRFWQQTGC